MASDRGYLEYVLEQLRDCGEISCREMMSEYILYFNGKVFGGIYDNRFLVKITASSKKMMPSLRLEKPYEGGKEMLLVENMEDRDFLKKLLNAMYDELPFPGKRKSSGARK